MLKSLRRCLTALAAVLAGLLATEAFVRVMVPEEIFFETWFTPGVHAYDREMGFVFAPNYTGMMRHEENLWVGRPIRLDPYGFRLPSRREDGTGAPRKVVCLGGRSIMMSYGLADEHTVPARIVAHSRHNLEIHNTAWAGDSLERSWHYFQRTLDRENRYDLAIVSIVNPWLAPFANRSDFTLTPDNRPEEQIFPFMEGVFLWRSPLFHQYPEISHKTYLGYALFRQLDRLQAALRGRSTRQRPTPERLVAGPAERDGFIRFLEHLENGFAARGTRVLFVFLPRRGFPPGYFAPLTERMPESLDWIDLHAEWISGTQATDFFAGNHYTQPMADRLGEHLAQLVDQRLPEKANDDHSGSD